MSMKLNRSAYELLITENLEWLYKQPRSLERDHIAEVLKASPDREYPAPEQKDWCSYGYEFDGNNGIKKK